MDPDRRLSNNPFARGLSPQPDDEKATSPVAYVLVGLLSLVLVVVFVAALVLPPMFMHTLIIRGVRGSRPGMLAAGLVLAAVYFVTLVGVGRRLMGRPAALPLDK
jgi:hypothetical protein